MTKQRGGTTAEAKDKENRLKKEEEGQWNPKTENRIWTRRKEGEENDRGETKTERSD